jgi:hypothetical protein
MKTQLLLFFAGLALLTPAQLRAINIDFYSDGTIEDGDVYDTASVYDTPPHYTTVDMLGGSVITLITYDSSIGNIYGGEITGSIETYNLSTVNIQGASVSLDFLAVEGNSALNVYTGDFFVGNSPIFSESSTVSIYGYDFNRGINNLTGFLSDGSPFAFNELPDDEYSHMNLIIIPEPATLFLLAFGSLLYRNHPHKSFSQTRKGGSS